MNVSSNFLKTVLKVKKNNVWVQNGSKSTIFRSSNEFVYVAPVTTPTDTQNTENTENTEDSENVETPENPQ